MIQFIINGISLSLPADLNLTREIETTIFNREITVTDFTYPVDIPLTDDVITALAFPNSIANPNLKQEYVADFIVNGIYVDQVVIRVLQVSISNKSASISVIGKYGAFARLLGGKKLNEIPLGGIRTIGSKNGTAEPLPSFTWNGTDHIFVYYYGCTSDYHINNVNAGTYVTDYVFGQCIEELSNNANQDGGVNVINGWNYWNNGPVGIIDGVRDYLLRIPRPTIMGFQDVPTERYYWCPQFRYAFLIRKCFEDFGFAVTGAILSDPAFLRVVMPNSYSINKCTLTTRLTNSNHSLVVDVAHDATTIDPRNHVPDMPVVEFLQEVGKLFNLHYAINLRNRTVNIVQIQEPASYGAIVDISHAADSNPDLNFEQQEYSRGFSFSFTDVGSAEIKDDVSKFSNLSPVLTFSHLATVYTSPAEKDICLVLDENAFYQFDGNDWVFYSDNLAGHKTSTEDNLQEISSSCVPIKMRRDTVPLIYNTGNNSTLVSHPYETGNFQVNGYTNYGITGRALVTFDISKRGDTGTEAEQMRSCFYTINPTQEKHGPGIANFVGMQQVKTWPSGTTYPQLSITPYTNPAGAAVAYSLPWNIPGATYSAYSGLANHFWKSFVASLAKCIEAEYKVMLDPVLFNNIDFNSNLIAVNGLWFLCKKASIVLPLPDIASLTLVRV